MILKINSRLQVDLFATHHNNKLKTFVSPCPDKRAAAVDAFSIQWEKWDHLYLYPPTPLISRVLAKLQNTSFRSAILVTPDFPTKPWYMSLQLLKVPSTILEVHLTQKVVNRIVTHQHSTKLRVWMLSRRHIRQGFQNAREQ